MSRPITFLTVFVLLVYAVMQFARAAMGVDVGIGTARVPMLVSWIVGLAAALLAAGTWWEARRAPPRTAAPASPAPKDIAPITSPPRAPPVVRQQPAPGRHNTTPVRGGLESVMVDGRPVPAAYFMFASKTLSIASIRKAKEKYGRVLVGFDAGGIPMNVETDNDSFAVARDLAAELEIYVEGPGGKTGDSWDPGEEARVKSAAKSVGIDTKQKGWRTKQWDTQGWKDFTFRQLAYYRGIGFNAGEIDNLDRVIKGPTALVAFYKEYGARQTAGELPQLVMKNISVEDMTAVIDALQSGQLPRMMFADFHIFECGNSDEWKEVDDLSKTQGIRTVPSRDTYNYDAKGTFGLDQEFASAMGLDRPATAGAVPTS